MEKNMKKNRYMYVCVLSFVWLFATPWIVTCQAPLSTEFSIQEYWVAISFSRGSSQPRDRTLFSCIAGRLFTIWVTKEYTEELYKKDLHDPDNHDGVITYLEQHPGVWSQVGLKKHYYKQS